MNELVIFYSNPDWAVFAPRSTPDSLDTTINIVHSLIHEDQNVCERSFSGLSLVMGRGCP